MLWLVMSITKSPTRMGLVSLCYGIPSVVVGMFAGLLMDRYPRLRLMVLDNLTQGMLFAFIPMMYWFHWLPFWLLCVTLTCAGTLSPLTMVGAMTLVPDLVPADSVTEANAWEETLWQAVGLVGPLIGGILINSLGAPIAILLDGLSFSACAMFFLLVHHKEGNIVRSKVAINIHSVASGVGTGVQTLVSMPVVLAITVVALLLNLAFGQLDVSLPLLVHQELRLGGAALGALWTANALGALMGSAAIGLLPTVHRTGIWMSAMVAGLGFSLIPFVWVRGFWLPVILMWSAGFCFGPYAPLARTVVQRQVPRDMRGRVFGTRTSIMATGGPVGSLLAGLMLHAVQPSTSITIMGIGIVIVSGAVLMFRPLRTLE